jgi:hypothetical protein
VTRDADTIGGNIKAHVTLVIRRVADNSAKSGVRGKFVGSGGSEVGVAGASKNLKDVIGRKSAVEGRERGAHV